jgi:hypothetical protein
VVTIVLSGKPGAAELTGGNNAGGAVATLRWGVSGETTLPPGVFRFWVMNAFR